MLCAAPATGIRQQILRARSSTAFFFKFFYSSPSSQPSGLKVIRKIKKGPWVLKSKKRFYFLAVFLFEPRRIIREIKLYDDDERWTRFFFVDY